MVGGIDADVVDVQQQVAVGFGLHRGDERGFAQRLARRGVVGHVLHRDAPAQRVLRLGDARAGVAHRCVGERQRQQFVELAVVGALAEVFAVQCDLVPIQELPGLPQQHRIQRRHAA